MLSLRNKIKVVILVGGDILVLYFSLWLTLLLRYEKAVTSEIWGRHWLPFTVVFFLWLIVFFINKLYDLETAKNGLKFYGTLFKSLIWSAMVGFGFFYIATTGISPKTILVLDIVIFGLLLVLWRRAFNTLIIHKRFFDNMLIVGMTEESVALAESINNKPQLGLKIVAMMKLPENQNHLEEKTDFTIIGEDQDLEEFIRKNKIKGIILATTLSQHEKIINQCYKSLPYKITIWDLPKFAEEFTGKILVNTIGQLWFLENIKEGNKKIYEAEKRLVDIMLSFLMLIVSIPFLPLIYLVIKIDSQGSGFFMQQRTGRNGKKFMAVKFRTMLVNAEKNGPQWAQKNDPRVTTVGRFLRKSRIDEIPQLINILRGEMSFIGPRPERPEFIEKLKEVIPFYETRLLIKPGLTGWAQINFPYGASEADALEKLQYDLYYIKNRSLTLDVSIILKTVKTVLAGGGQ
ncbi:MAG TPA: sugar transferase [Patescibacteria group bacterium]|nr:sugar transferase [Patescibacteria group bacterium]